MYRRNKQLKVLGNWFLGKNGNNVRNSILWNSVASIEYSFQSAVLVLVVTRINGLHDAGIFIFAYTIAQLLTTIGNYGMRGFQVSDSRREFSFQEYFSLRIVTAVIMVGAGIAYSFGSGADSTKRLLIMVLCFYRMIEVLEDVVHGELQKMQRLDIGAKIEALRILMSTLAFSICCLITQDIVVASVVMVLTCLLMMLGLNVLVLKNFAHIRFGLKWAKLHKLLLACFPICASDFLYNYLINAPKYAIERNLSEELQAVFSILFMPVFIVNMLSIFIYKPFITNMGMYWGRKDIKKLSHIIFKQIAVILLLTFLIITGGMTVGLRLMELIYGVGLGEYKNLFMILLIFGGVAAMDVFLVVVLTVVRRQYWAIVAYAISIFCVWIGIDRAVCTFGLWGAGISYGLAVVMVLIVLLPIVLNTLHKANAGEYC